MRYIVTGVDGKLGGRVAENMLLEVPSHDLIFTCPDLKRLAPEKAERWNDLGVSLRQADYNDKEDDQTGRDAKAHQAVPRRF